MSMNEPSGDETPTAIRDRWRPPTSVRWVALGYAVITGIAAALAWVEYSGVVGLDALAWFPMVIGSTGVFVGAMTGALLLWCASSKKAATIVYTLCVSLAAVVAIVAIGMLMNPIIAVGVLPLAIVPGIYILVALNRPSEGSDRVGG
ncbi:hypothetical protein [Stackebrandtia nassauensis]|uniref:hypothetical protein n=1 Tax=Stackebrandtia nassauensis TaxID=283811 RepID=UPI0011872156|nr:hypothetical protein [Stackebrandtia nassauensis]